MAYLFDQALQKFTGDNFRKSLKFNRRFVTWQIKSFERFTINQCDIFFTLILMDMVYVFG
jgi:hypothetical protein